MHFHVEVLVPYQGIPLHPSTQEPDYEALQDKVVEILYPFHYESAYEGIWIGDFDTEEEYEQAIEEAYNNWNPGFSYDWFVIGGRWRGVHLHERGVIHDLELLPCTYCNRTGIRNDIRDDQECHTCRGSGLRLPFGGGHDQIFFGDVIHSVDAPWRLEPFGLVDQDGQFSEKPEPELIRVPGHWLVTVDCHS